jgi:hypothetical protein
VHGREVALTGQDVQAQNFAGFTLGNNFKRSAADFAIRGKSLRRHRGIDGNFEGLAAKRAIYCLRDFHAAGERSQNFFILKLTIGAKMIANK